jgi:serine/threonine protein kinase
VILEPDVAFEDIDESVEPNASRWYSPEILRPDGFGLTEETAAKAGDMYAFGMLAYEVGPTFYVVPQCCSTRTQVFSGRVPFYDKTDVEAAATVITTDERPSRPTHQQLFDQLWEMIEKCWRRDPSQRPTILEVVNFLEGFHRS